MAIKNNKGEPLTAKEKSWLQRIANSFHTDSTNSQELLIRIDIFPVGLVMVQAIEESGWGTSHFATVGNALTGNILVRAVMALLLLLHAVTLKWHHLTTFITRRPATFITLTQPKHTRI